MKPAFGRAAALQSSMSLDALHRLGEPRVFTFTDDRGAFVVPANGAERTNIRLRNDRGFLLTALGIVGTDTDLLTLFITDEGRRKSFMSAPVIASLISSPVRGRPYHLVPPYYCAPNGAIGVDWGDLSGAPQTVQLAVYGFELSAEGARFIQQGALPMETPFYAPWELAIPGGGEVSANLSLQGGGRMRVRQLQATVRTGYDAELWATSGDRAFSSRSYAAELQMGFGEYPGELAVPYTARPQEDLTLTLTDTGGGAQTVRGCLAGSKVWTGEELV